MSYTKEQIDQLWKESVRRERSLVAEYKEHITFRAVLRFPRLKLMPNRPNRSVYMASIAN